MTGITAFALEKNRVTLLFLLLMAVAGFFSYLTYPKQEDPSIQIREAVVWAYFPGMPPNRVEIPSAACHSCTLSPATRCRC